ncbi:cyclic AMP-dependent transcription factor ATF-1-like isoform X3 [Gymnodraco acuticeps]|uniref:Cyclic AMP-dependent transcription factor ATF-1-like isoform X3 n=1 Tax=Gymnodraco acuticeps TaxID=8218 RepID=A0A6P8UNZ1_GYMAC|nr:cyclic AMP-dependent transcription factor ATF-1-like isoform X3 [Gymnodraco acuticeps]
MMAVTGDETETGTSGDLTACQLQNTGSSLPQGGAETSTQGFVKSADPSQKKEHRLMKNRDAAKRYRGRKKDYIDILLERIDSLEKKNEKQSAELQRLKNDTAINIPL